MNRKLELAGNVCFGCGQDNPHGLQISVSRDPANTERIMGEFQARDHMIGFPGITHGGTIYTALDCMATWSGMVLRGTKAMWVLRSAEMKYHRPAMQSEPLSLSATITSEGGEWDAIEVTAEARDPKGNLLAGGVFKVIPVPPEKFKIMTGIDELPEGWAEWLEENGT
ncbi:MAG: hotdog fold domain-containing protein [Candidatus Thiodiazotropha endolucinida]